MVIHRLKLQEWFSPGLDYLHKRGLTDDTIQQFGLMHFDGTRLHSHPKTRTSAWFPFANTVFQNEYYQTRFKDTIVLPIFDLHGNYISIMVRYLENKTPKFGGVPYTKSNTVFGLQATYQNILQQNEVYVTEGLFDFLVLWQSGVRNSVAANGCNLTDTQINLLSRFCQKFKLVYDPDPAGDTGVQKTRKAIQKLGKESNVIRLDEKCDLDDYILKKGVQQFLQLKQS